MKTLFIYSSIFAPESSNFKTKQFKDKFNKFIDIEDEYKSFDNHHSIDIFLDDFVNKSCNDHLYDLIFVPASFGNIFTNFFGVNLLWHIRFTRNLKDNRFVPIIFYTSNNFYDIANFNSLYEILMTKNTFISSPFHSDLLAFLNKIPKKLTEVEFKSEVVDKLHLDIPKSYFDNHSIANEWGVYRLNEVAETNLEEIKNREFLKKIYFKWLISKSKKIPNLLVDKKNKKEEKVRDYLHKLEDPKKLGKIDLND